MVVVVVVVFCSTVPRTSGSITPPSVSASPADTVLFPDPASFAVDWSATFEPASSETPSPSSGDAPASSLPGVSPSEPPVVPEDASLSPALPDVAASASSPEPFGSSEAASSAAAPPAAAASDGSFSELSSSSCSSMSPATALTDASSVGSSSSPPSVLSPKIPSTPTIRIAAAANSRIGALRRSSSSSAVVGSTVQPFSGPVMGASGIVMFRRGMATVTGPDIAGSTWGSMAIRSCAANSLAVAGRSAGSLAMDWATASATSSGTSNPSSVGGSSVTTRIITATSVSLAPVKNGAVPVMRAASVAPRPYTSLSSVASKPLKRSGGINDGVPSDFDDFDTDESMSLAMPKSDTRGIPEPSRRMLPGLRSLCSTCSP